MRMKPLAATALVGAVFLCLVAVLTSGYLALVMPSYERLFTANSDSEVSVTPVRAAAAPVPAMATATATATAAVVPQAQPVTRPQSRPWSGGQPPVAARAAAPAPSLVPPPVPDSFEVAAVVPAPDPRPAIRPASVPELADSVTVAASAAAPDPARVALMTLAAVSSPRPPARPKGLAPAVTLAAAPAAPAVANPAVQTASLVQPGVPLYRGGKFSGSCSARLSRAIPRRSGRAPGGSDFVATLANAAGGSRDAAIARAAIEGNVPDFLRRLVPVKLAGTLADGRQAEITICVTPDYLAIGSNRDYVRVPLGLRAAGQVAEAFNMMLPTTRMVDAIYAQAAVRLAPRPMPAGGQMVTTAYFLRHNTTLQAQLASAGAPLGALVAGQKKDLVLTNRLSSSPGRVAIYGWHRGNGSPIQPLSTVHGAAYADYSHGIRLVSRTAYLNGRPVDLRELLQDRRYARLLSTEGPVGASAIRIASR